MGKGIIDIAVSEVTAWFVAGKRLDDTKELLLLPESYIVEKMCEPISKEEVSIVVSSPDIPDVQVGEHFISIKVWPNYRQDENGSKRLESMGMYIPARTISVPYNQREPALIS